MGIKCFSKDCQLITTTSPNNRRGLRPRTKDIPSANRRYYDRTNYSGAAPLPSALPVPRFLLCPSASTKRQTLPSADSERKRSDPSTATPPRTKANMSLNLSSYQKHLFSVPQKSSPGSSDSTTVSVADSMPWISEAESSKNAHLQSGIQQSLTSASLTKPNLPSELLQPRPLEICEMRNPLEIESMQERTCSAAWEQTREAFVLWDRNQVLLQHLESKLEINLMKQQFIQREYILQWSQ